MHLFKRNSFISGLLTFAVILLTAYSFSGCGKNLPEDKAITGGPYSLVNQDSSKVVFPDNFKGKILVMSFIYTNCPDICPLTTHNMQTIQQRLKEDNINDVEFAELTFDPERDTPGILKEYGDVRDINYSHFQFLTGKKSVIDTILHRMDVMAIPSDTTYTKDGKPIYFFTHTDRITLIDRNGNIRNEYRGSKIKVDAILKDIKTLED